MSLKLNLEFKRDTGLKLFEPECTNPELGNSVLIMENVPLYIDWLEEKISHLDNKIEDYKSEIIVNNSLNKK